MNSTAPAAYAEMASASNFSFLRGASHPQDMLLTALLLGHSGIGIADRNTIAGVVRAHAALRELRESGVPPPDKIRAGGSPGEFVFIEHEWNGEEPPNRDVLRKLAENFKLIVGARLAFADGTPGIIAER